ncbi:MAG: two-component regulator propeller domain-containing protein [Bacteroidota bacterium]
MRPALRLVLSFLFLLRALPFFSQTYNFRNYTVDDGLPFVYVYTIHQDSKGYLWTGGYGGLSRFDGKTFVNYTAKNGLLNNWVTAIAEGDSGELYVGTIKGLSVLQNGKFTNYTPENEKGLPGERVNTIHKSADGIIYVGTNKGLCRITGKKFEHVSAGFPGDNVKTLIGSDQRKIIYAGTDNGIGMLPESGALPPGFPGRLYNKNVNALVAGKKNELWVGTDSGLYVAADGSVALNAYFKKDGLPSDKITALLYDVKGNLWIGTDKEICRYDGKTFKTYYIRGRTTSTNVFSLYSDYEGNIWIGTNNALYRFRGESFTTFTTVDGLNNAFIFQVLRDSKNNLWIGTDGGGLNKYVDGKFSAYTVKNGLPGNKINAGIEAADGKLWFATSAGLVTFDGKAFSLVNAGLPRGAEVFAVMQDSKGHIWIGVENAVMRYNGAAWEKIPLIARADKVQPWCIFEDKKGHIWIGTYLGGLFRYDGGKIEDHTFSVAKKSDSYLSIVMDSAGVLYFATFEGVYAYDGKQVTQFSEEDGMSSDLVYAMVMADNGNTLWAGTNQGLNKIHLDEFRKSGKKRIEPYGKEEGFFGVELNTNGAWLDQDGTIWFGTVNGLIKYTPGEFIPNNTSIRTNITGTRIFYTDTVITQGITLPYYLNNITFEFIGICLTNPAKVRYSYMLEGGEEKGWSPETKSSFARFSNLPEGKYTFKVKSRNNEGIWNETPATFSFIIGTPWWKTWWFRTAFVVFLAGTVFLAVRLRIRQVEYNERNKVRLANNELKALRSQMNPHFIFNALNSIQHFIMSSDEQGASKYLNKFAKLIRSILNNTEKSSVTLKEEIESLKLYLELEVLRFENKFDYGIHVDPSIDLDFYEVPTLLIQPYVENAIIHGLVPKKDKGKLDIAISLEDNFIVCVIQDNGIGRKRSMEMKEKSMKRGHKSFGMKITRDRLELLNSVRNSSLSVNITDLENENGEPLGTKVEIFIPIV